MTFKDLHYQTAPLLLCNVWDVASAQLAEQLGFKAIGTSSAAIAASQGFVDGEQMPFDSLYSIVKQIRQHSTLPLTVDIESGYSREAKQIAENIKRLSDAGVVGINIEDSVVTQQRSLLNADAFSATISHVKQQLSQQKIDVFINVRSDVFLLNTQDAIEQAKQRIALYTAAGANGIFLPCLEKAEDIQAICEFSELPINVMCMPHLADFTQLQAWGVKRISMGNFLFENMQQHLKTQLNRITLQQSFASLF
ncbi:MULTISPECIES: isocitrate lyase/PEP mutase family protein [unclassified Agarivorans]|uniref:isocitrate lyase/PEP mutase family protein n=1 Tax=unclassified Agarivorans TaxID=2636026 RepID=UPI0026E323F3|nr:MULTISPECIES: isocitrate lyase/phosphoenolpyruvate mutase family protein [unclassified Agarivorans]MDO6687512.1 isocitrate lyase/phosphoenolpyruvate mutase family protein [Agarivorans sp. 3_MG-2023]MDO6717155.1 isocitrate lyase/phosphoenolpyruvate mutase family protein [Agarivorans sp. 2_MG-2023]